MSLLDFLSSHGCIITPERSSQNDGYISEEQKKQFTKELLSSPSIQSIAEIGFNAGHSAEHFFQSCPSLKMFVAFDLNCFPCTSIGSRYFYQHYPDRFVLVYGDSLKTVPEVSEKFPHMKFDLIYIDGCHDFDWAVGDLMNAKKIAHERTLLWIDDVEENPLNEVGAAIKFCEMIGFIKIEKRFESNDPILKKRQWIQAKIIF